MSSQVCPPELVAEDVPPGEVYELVRQTIRNDTRFSSHNEAGCSSFDKKLTIILTTSPTKSNPDTSMLEIILASFTYVPGLSQCELLLVCDGVIVKDPSNLGYRSRKASFRSGVVPGEDGLARYQAYKQRIKEFCARTDFFPGGVRVLELSDRHGFGLAVRVALKEVRTPFVMVVQHDRSFMRPFDIGALLDVMEDDDSLKMVALLNSSLYSHAERLFGRVRLPDGENWRDGLVTLNPRPGIRIKPLYAWLDTTHVARTQHYWEFIMCGGIGPEGKLKRGGFIEGHYSLYSQLKRGGFIEDKVGQAQLNELRRFGLSSHARHGTWIVDDGVEDRLTGHLDGGHFRKDKWLQAKKSRGWTFRDVVESLGGGEEVEGCEGGVGGERGGKKGDENGEG